MPSLTSAPVKRSLAAAILIASFSINTYAETDQPSHATVKLTDGSVIMGAVIGIRGDKLLLKTAFSDELGVDVTLVESLQWLQASQIMLDDERVIELPALQVADNQLDLGGETIALADIDIMNPEPWEQGIGYHWKGDTSAALAYNRGNTETDELDVSLNTVFKSVADRYTVNAKYEQDYTYNQQSIGNVERSVKTATADNWKLLVKYDYFLDDSRNYIGLNGSVEADALAGIDMRTYAGPYIGRKLVEREELTLDGELGIAYVSTDYDENLGTEDFDYTAVNWSFTGESNILGGDSRIYLRHTGILDLENSSDVILKNTLGLAFPLLYGLEAAAEITVDYDGTAAADREEIDETYKVRVGYAW